MGEKWSPWEKLFSEFYFGCTINTLTLILGRMLPAGRKVHQAKHFDIKAKTALSLITKKRQEKMSKRKKAYAAAPTRAL